MNANGSHYYVLTDEQQIWSRCDRQAASAATAASARRYEGGSASPGEWGD
jgi:hypothetical protein